LTPAGIDTPDIVLASDCVMTWHGSAITSTAEGEGVGVVDGAAFPAPSAGVGDVVLEAAGVQADRHSSAPTMTVIHGFVRTTPPWSAATSDPKTGSGP
jgi:hypothetical protein